MVLLAELISLSHSDVNGDSIFVWNKTISLHWSNLYSENRHVNTRNTYKQMEMLEVKQNDRRCTQSIRVWSNRGSVFFQGLFAGLISSSDLSGDVPLFLSLRILSRMEGGIDLPAKRHLALRVRAREWTRTVLRASVRTVKRDHETWFSRLQA